MRGDVHDTKGERGFNLLLERQLTLLIRPQRT
jgi:hypothetical protein